MSSLECYHCEGSELTQETCADNYTLQTCGSHPDGHAYNACYSRNITFNMPYFGARFAEKKGCTLSNQCDFMRTIECFNISGLVLDCLYTCCVENECNVGILQSLAMTTPPLTIKTGDVMKSRTSPLLTTQETRIPTGVPTVESSGGRQFMGIYFRLLLSTTMILIEYY